MQRRSAATYLTKKNVGRGTIAYHADHNPGYAVSFTPDKYAGNLIRASKTPYGDVIIRKAVNLGLPRLFSIDLKYDIENLNKNAPYIAEVYWSLYHNASHVIIFTYKQCNYTDYEIDRICDDIKSKFNYNFYKEIQKGQGFKVSTSKCTPVSQATVVEKARKWMLQGYKIVPYNHYSH